MTRPGTSRLPRPPAVRRVLERVAATARRHRMFEPGTSVLVAVSGGPDSLCLLHTLVRLRRLLRIEPACFHFDHRLREGSEADGAYVRRQAERLGVPFYLRIAESGPARGQSVEAWARGARYEALLTTFEDRGGGTAALGHTADDQAETVLLALFRGAGLEALSGMRPVSRPLVRPLLEVTREETEAFCRALRLRPRRDPMNDDPAFMRVAVRKHVLPAVELALGRGVRSTLVRTAALLAEDADLLDAMARDATRQLLEADGSDRLLRSDALIGIPVPVAGRVVRGALAELGVPPEAAHIDAVLDLARGRPGRRRFLPGGLRAERNREYVRLTRPSPGSEALAGPPATRTATSIKGGIPDGDSD